MKSDDEFNAFLERYKDDLPMLMRDPFFKIAFKQKNLVTMEENRALLMDQGSDAPEKSPGKEH